MHCHRRFSLQLSFAQSMNPSSEALCIGLDYGTDAVRALLVRVSDGKELACGVCEFPRWKKGLFTDPHAHQYRQHPLDYLEGAEKAVNQLFSNDAAGASMREKVVGLAVDATGSTPCLVDESCTPLSMHPQFKENPNAMFILWKDHTSVSEAEAINRLAHSQKPDYTSFSGGTYSSEWFWSKALHVARTDSAVAAAAYSVVEASEWIPAHFAGISRYQDLVRSRCACGHKAMWHASWGGFPPAEFFAQLHPDLKRFRERMGTATTTADKPIGRLSPEWAKRFGLPQTVVVGGGVIDAHAGAIGAGCKPYTFLRVMGTSTCDMMVLDVANSPNAALQCIPGICGQVDGSIVPGQVGLEAGQSAYGDVFAWFSRLLSSSAVDVLRKSGVVSTETLEQAETVLRKNMLKHLSQQAEERVGKTEAFAVDWFNGRRSPVANQRLRGTVSGLTIGTDGPSMYAALLEATAFGSRAIVEHLRNQNVRIDNVVAVGGITKKSPLAMQVLADALGMPVRVCQSEQACALGAAIIAATAAGCFNSIPAAQRVLASGFAHEYEPQPSQVELLRKRYEGYQTLAVSTEKLYAKM